MKLIPSWRQAWRLWSVRMSAIGAILMTMMIAAPDALLTAWNTLPDDMRALIPDHIARYVSLALFLASAGARLVRQKAATDA